MTAYGSLSRLNHARPYSPIFMSPGEDLRQIRSPWSVLLLRRPIQTMRRRCPPPCGRLNTNETTGFWPETGSVPPFDTTFRRTPGDLRGARLARFIYAGSDVVEANVG